ncbi:xanthine dehydrogenase family protein molybdopterin-binding subunit [Nonomuraea lactucae]|uniref:xanthine dehydrogenase family protein molybdopterin-binding subunit n=1 Tax=Nonomuraea lactucae TaxID=2249762 RepID=UPI000DE31BA9|nr:xanthine dehydrogenase family protein molybdopterin-binding subunit [Nonomuraea lactucae]
MTGARTPPEGRLPRVDARDKVTGAAEYTYDHSEPGQLHAALVCATFARGVLRDIRTAAAEVVPGVRLILTHRDTRGAVGPGLALMDGGQFHTSFDPLAGPEVRYHGQMVALVVADTPEQAEQAAALVELTAEELPAQVDPYAADEADDIEVFALRRGDPAGAVTHADLVVEATYETAAQLHQPIEPYATNARWSGDRLTVWSPTQWVVGEKHGLAAALGVEPDQVRVISRHVGGAFGGKALTLWHTVYTAEAARRLRRPVRLGVRRGQMATLGSFRPASRHRVRLAARRDGTLLGYEHACRTQGSRSDVLPLGGTALSARLYRFGAVAVREHVVPTDVITPGFMRAPLEFPTSFALECAIDELAVAAGLDPVELRRLNEPEVDPVDLLPFSGRNLPACLDRGAELFGWSRRQAPVGSMADPRTGETLGWGVAAAYYPGYGGGPTFCRARLSGDGVVEIALAAQDPGTGLRTALAQLVVERLRADPRRVRISLGDSDLPLAPMAAGSCSSATAAAAVEDAADRLLRRLRDLARKHWPGQEPAPGQAVPDRHRIVTPGGTSIDFGEIARREDGQAVTVEGSWIPEGLTPGMVADARAGRFVQAHETTPTAYRASYGAHFAEVGVDRVTGRVRVRRMVGVFDVGRVLHAAMLKNQLRGGMLWGVGHALMEQLHVDKEHGRFMGVDLGSYHILTHADAPAVEVELVTPPGPHADPVGARGAGEIGVVGSSAAVANAVFHATGRRIRRLPIRAHDLVDQ